MTPKTVFNKSEEQSVNEIDEEQQVINEANQKMDDKLENLQKLRNKQINKPNYIVYNLEWNKRDDLILNLNYYSSILIGKQLTIEQKESLIEKNVNLYRDLIKLSTKSNSENSNKLIQVSKNEDSQLILELDYKTRSKIIEILIANQSLSLIDDSSSNNGKLNLINQNNELIYELLKLPVRIIESNTQKLDEKKESLSKESPFDKKTDSLNKKMEIIKEINGLKMISSDRPSLSELNANFMTKKVDEFLQSKYLNAKESERFYCQCIEWWIILVKVKEPDGDFFRIHLNNDFKKSKTEFFTGSYNLVFINQQDSNKSKKFSGQINSKDSQNYSCISNDIKESFDQLKKEGFIYDDSIKINVDLKVEKFGLIHL